MPSLCCYFQVHQPLRLRHYTFFDIGQSRLYADEPAQRTALNRAATQGYLPANALLLRLLREYRGDFRVAFALTGPALDLFARHEPAVLDGFKRLADTGHVEFLSATDCHSLAFFFSKPEFRAQVREQRARLRRLFGRAPTTFCPTELIYNNALAREAEALGHRAILADGGDPLLGWRNPNCVYQVPGCHRLRLLPRNSRLSDDLALRLAPRTGSPPSAGDALAAWFRELPAADETVVVGLDYARCGADPAAGPGGLDFLRALPRAALALPACRFQTPAEAAQAHAPSARLSAPDTVAGAGTGRGVTAWLGNDLQQDALHALYALEPRLRRRRSKPLTRTWRALQSADHFYYMCTRWATAGDALREANPYPSPYDAYINYMNILTDFERRVAARRERRRHE